MRVRRMYSWSWLPLYRNMGLIGAWLGTLHYGVPTVIMPPLAFLADPGRWLRAIGRHRATLSAAPNFAFELCCKNVRDEDIKDLDPQLAPDAAKREPSRSDLPRSHATARFASYGFPPKAMAPVYGLAAELRWPHLSSCRAGTNRRTGSSAQRFPMKDRPAPAWPEDATALEFVACGWPIAGHKVRIVATRLTPNSPSEWRAKAAVAERSIRDARLLPRRREDQGAVRRRMAGKRRPSLHRRRRCVHHGPHQGHDHQGRTQHLPA